MKKIKDMDKKSMLPNHSHDKFPSISVCMIVKNEEEFLEKCLTSVKDHVDEMVIVDTGSTDNTAEIAKRFTDKVYFHPWENSFSKARNQALQYATGDWVFQIDGDEELMEGSGEKLQQTIKKAKDADIVYIKIYSTYSKGTKKALHNFERLFRNNGKIHYEGSVHNRIVGGTKPYYSDIELWHYGYDVDGKKAEEKYIRTSELLKKEIKQDPQNPLHRHYLSASYVSRRMMEDAIDEAKRAIELADTQDNKHPVYSWSHFIVSKASHALGLYDQAREYAFKALDKYPGHMDSYYMLAVIASEKKDWDDTIKYGKLFLEKLEMYSKNGSEAGLIINNTMNEGPAVYILMGHACYSIQDFSGMEVYYGKAYDMADEKWQVWWNIGTFYLDKSWDMDQAGEYLKRAASEAPEEYDVWYMLAKYNNKCNRAEDEKSCLEKLVVMGTDDSFLFRRLLSIYIDREDADKALDLISSSNLNTGHMDPSLYPELITLGNLFMKNMDLESATQCYMKAVEAKPDSPEAWSVLAEITLSMGKLDDSRIFMEKALQIKGNDIINLLTMCELNLKMGDIESHIYYCDKVLGCLGLDRDRTIDGFHDLKDLFIEIDHSIAPGNNHSIKISNIINQLDLHIHSPEQATIPSHYQ